MKCGTRFNHFLSTFVHKSTIIQKVTFLMRLFNKPQNYVTKMRIQLNCMTFLKNNRQFFLHTVPGFPSLRVKHGLRNYSSWTAVLIHDLVMMGGTRNLLSCKKY